MAQLVVTNVIDPQFMSVEFFLFTFKMHWKDQQKMPRMDQFKK